jgi:hypothetical protein
VLTADMSRSGDRAAADGDTGELMDASRYCCSRFCGSCQITFFFEEMGKNLKDVWRFRRMSLLSKSLGFLRELEAFMKRSLTFRKKGVITQRLPSVRWA